MKSVVTVLFVEVSLTGMTEGRPLPFIKGYSWMTYYLTVHTTIMPMSKKNGEGWGNRKTTELEINCYGTVSVEMSL